MLYVFVKGADLVNLGALHLLSSLEIILCSSCFCSHTFLLCWSVSVLSDILCRAVPGACVWLLGNFTA